jgi:hypothetical protein
MSDNGLTPEQKAALEALAKQFDEEGKKPTQAMQAMDRVLELADLFHDGETTYATLHDRHIILPLADSRFKSWIGKVAYDTLGAPANSSTRSDVLGALQGEALYEGREVKVHVRLARDGDSIYLDLGDDTGAAVKISRAGWAIVQPPVKFWRPRGLEPLPRPVQGGSVDDLRGILNPTKEPAGWRLQIAWLVAALRPEGPFPVLYHYGEQGSAKSTQQKMLRRIIDPNKSPLRATPKEVRDLMVAATNSLVIGFDNLSGLRDWLSDALCRLATGGGFSTRQLYTDQDEQIFEVMRPVLLNGISEVGTRPDLLDRSLVVELVPLVDRRRPERDLWREFDAAHPYVLGALCTAVARGLADVDTVTFDDLPRMADFAQWATAAAPAFGWAPGEFMRDYTGNIAEANEIAIESATFFPALTRVAGDEFTGTMTDLLATMIEISDERTTRQEGWPKNARTLSSELRRIAPNLRKLDPPILIDFGRSHSPRRLTIKLGKLASSSSPASSEDAQDARDANFPTSDSWGKAA